MKDYSDVGIDFMATTFFPKSNDDRTEKNKNPHFRMDSGDRGVKRFCGA